MNQNTVFFPAFSTFFIQQTKLQFFFILGGPQLFKQLAVTCWLLDNMVYLKWKESNSCQTWANSQNDNYFYCNWSKIGQNW